MPNNEQNLINENEVVSSWAQILCINGVIFSE